MASRDDTSLQLDSLLLSLERDLLNPKRKANLGRDRGGYLGEYADWECFPGVRPRLREFWVEANKKMYSLESDEESCSLFFDLLPRFEHLMHIWAPKGLLDHFTPLFSNSIGIPMKLVNREITIPLDPKSPREELLLQLNNELSKLEEKLSALEAEIQFPRHHPHYEWDSLSLYQKVQVLHREISLKGFVCKPESQRKLHLLAKRMELLFYKAHSYELSAQSNRDRFLLSLIVPRFESLLKKRSTMIREKHVKLSEIKDKLTWLFFEIKDKPTWFQPNDDMMLWKLTCFPQVHGVEWEEWFRKPKPLEFSGLFKELGPLLESAVIDPVDMKEGVSELDVLPYLSTSGGELIRRNGNRVALNKDTFKQKYVRVCCFNVPFLYRARRLDLYNLINLCQELYSTGRADFEMVVVARMNPLANTEEVFNHFFSGFPESCLAVPFEDCQKRDYICSLLGLGTCPDRYKSLFLNPITKGPVLTNFWNYGAEAFPFTEYILDQKHEECRMIVFGEVGLDRVLRCNKDSPHSLNKLSPSGDILETVPISKFSDEVRDKHVGLYWCTDGSLVPYLREMFDKCREEQLEFEVVVVNMPIGTGTDPVIHEREICSWLKEHIANDWWCLPFNNSVSLRFWRLTQSAEMNHSDKLIVVGPDAKRLDLYGSNAMVRQGIDAFPFTRDAGMKRAKEKLQESTLESLFKKDDDDYFFRGKDRKDRITLRQLVDDRKKRKKIVVCIDLLYHGRQECGWDWDEVFGELASVYDELGSKEGFEVVFIEVGNVDKVKHEDRKEYISRMPWYICPREKTNLSIVEKLSKWFWDDPASRQDALIGFGEDNRLCSYMFKEYLYQGLFTSLDCNIGMLLGYSELTDHCADGYSIPRRRRPNASSVRSTRQSYLPPSLVS